MSVHCPSIRTERSQPHQQQVRQIQDCARSWLATPAGFFLGNWSDLGYTKRCQLPGSCFKRPAALVCGKLICKLSAPCERQPECLPCARKRRWIYLYLPRKLMDLIVAPYLQTQRGLQPGAMSVQPSPVTLKGKNVITMKSMSVFHSPCSNQDLLFSCGVCLLMCYPLVFEVPLYVHYKYSMLVTHSLDQWKRVYALICACSQGYLQTA